VPTTQHHNNIYYYYFIISDNMTVVASLPTTVTTNHQNEKHRKSPSILVSDASKARLFLALACFWPLVIMVLFAASSPQLKDVRSHPRELLDTSNTINQDVRYTFRSIMDRVDIMGYGPTHPRIAVVVVGEDNRSILTSVGSLFSYVKLRDNSFTAAAFNLLHKQLDLILRNT